MKKTKNWIGLLSIVLLTLASCSTDEFDNTETNVTETVSNPNGTVLKKTTAIIKGSTTVVTGEYFYDGDKLVKTVSSDGKSTNYIYTGNLITGREFYSNSVLNNKEFFEYNSNNQLTTVERVNPNNVVLYKSIYVYNGDGTITVTGYRGATTDQNSVINSRKIFLVNGQVSKIETNVTSNGNVVVETANYTFDNKKTPYESILGFDKLTLYDVTLSGSANNIKTIGYTSSVTLNPEDNDLFEYVYNANGYPISASEAGSSSMNGSIIFQFFYE